MGEDFEIIYNPMKTPADWKRSYSITFFPGVANRRIYYNDRTLYDPSSKAFCDVEYLHTSAHELGHVLLKHAYGRKHSWEHQGTTGFAKQDPLPDAPLLPANTSATEVELMWYYKKWVTGQKSYYNDGIASKSDIRGAIWLATLSFS